MPHHYILVNEVEKIVNTYDFTWYNYFERLGIIISFCALRNDCKVNSVFTFRRRTLQALQTMVKSFRKPYTRMTFKIAYKR